MSKPAEGAAAAEEGSSSASASASASGSSSSRKPYFSNATKWRSVIAVVYGILTYQVYDVNQNGNTERDYGDALNGQWNDAANFMTIQALTGHVPEFLCQLSLAVLFTLGHMLTRKLFFNLSDKLIKRKKTWSEDVRAARRDRWCASIFKLTYFIIVSIWGWQALTAQDWVPPALGGSGDLANLLPRVTRPGQGDLLWWQPVKLADEVNWYYRVASAYHMSELLFQVMIEWDRPDFYDMFLHHLCTCWLLFFSMVAGMTRHGTLILFIHDVSDIPVYLCKFTVDVHGLHDAIVLTPFVGMLVSWGYLRLWFLPQVIWSIVRDVPLLGLRGHEIFVFMLSCLVLLHCFWYCKFIQMGMKFLRGGGAEDNVANLQQLDKKKKTNTIVTNEGKDFSGTGDPTHIITAKKTDMANDSSVDDFRSVGN